MFESSLHAHLKSFYIQDGGSTEIWVEGYLVDVVKDQELIEIQTGNFPALKTKLENLLRSNRVCVVLPIALEKYIIVRDSDLNVISRRRSPKRGRIEHLFYNLVYIAKLAAHPNFSLEVLMTSEEEDRVADGRGSWRRRGVSIENHRLVSILQRASYPDPEAYLSLIPADIPSVFTNLELSKTAGIPIRLASKMTYSLLQMGVLEKRGHSGRAILYGNAS